jgi:UDP-N-acetylglucosamine--N-acetylmuramyl-(pentapeptide) pyrophosphoryl-undecaprenol N-acetylglucosamine transferase
MAEAYAWADLVICRAGALTVAEIAAAGLPAIFVPFPWAVDDHQTANARPMTDAGAAALIPEKDLNGLLRQWLSSREELLARARKSRQLARPDALRRITSYCLEAAGAMT